MNISFEFFHLRETSPLPPEVTRVVELIVGAGSTPIEELHRVYGGTLPQEVTVVFVRGPVGRRVRWKDGKLDVTDTLGAVLVQGHGVFVVVLGLGSGLRATTLHEYMHVLRHFKEKFVKKAVEDFIRYHRWLASGAPPLEPDG